MKTPEELAEEYQTCFESLHDYASASLAHEIYKAFLAGYAAAMEQITTQENQ